MPHARRARELAGRGPHPRYRTVSDVRTWRGPNHNAMARHRVPREAHALVTWAPLACVSNGGGGGGEAGCTYPKNLPRVVLVVSDAARAQSPLGHDRIKPRVRDGEAATATRWLLAANERVDCGVPTMLFFYLGISAAPHPEEQTPHGTGDHKHANHHTGGNPGSISAAATARPSGCCACLSDDDDAPWARSVSRPKRSECGGKNNEPETVAVPLLPEEAEDELDPEYGTERFSPVL